VAKAGTFTTMLALISMVALLISGIMLLHLIQRAFEREGILWGMIAILYPPGTYLYCRKNWDLYRKTFVWITGLLVVALVLWLVVRFVA